jgi:hypothetical protein
MKLSATALALSTLCLAVSACGETKRVAEALPTPPERLVCERAGTRPALPPEHAIDWSKVRTVDAARLEHEKFVTVLRTREGLVAGYVLKLEGVAFTCWNNMKWRREYEAGLAKPQG